MSRLAKKIIIIFFFILVTGAIVWFFQKERNTQDIQLIENVQDVGIDEIIKNDKDEENIEIVSNVEIAEDIKNIPNAILEVPFVLQAPFGNWSDPLFEDACEEAAILMASGWLEGKKFTSQEAFDEIKKIAEMEKKILGEYIDASAEDTAKIFEEYSGSQNVEVIRDISVDNIVSEISKGNLVIVPTNGKKLGNPNYTAPGPITHMIVIIGYDGAKKEFITNDSGTRKGERYRYSDDVLFEAIRDYPTGNHYKNPISESNLEKIMIVVRK